MRVLLICAGLLGCAGCSLPASARTAPASLTEVAPGSPLPDETAPAATPVPAPQAAAPPEGQIVLASHAESEADVNDQATPSGRATAGAGNDNLIRAGLVGMTAGVDPSALALDDVIATIYQAYPLLDAALREREIADGQRLASAGEFDLKFKGASENQPLGYYQTYRQNFGLVQPLYGGGEVFGGYRLGRGSFEPWYLNRQTNGGGEFKVGGSIPLLRNRLVDERRAGLWKNVWERQLVEPEIQAQLIEFVRAGSYAYWEWVAAGKKYRIAESLLDLSLGRDTAIRRKVEEGEAELPLLKDNRRLIVSREAKLIDSRRKLQQTAIKLSLYYRDDQGTPVIPLPTQLPDFPAEPPVSAGELDADIVRARDNRPELRALDLQRRQLEVDLAQAHNEFQPGVDGYVAGSRDVGAESSYQGYKTPIEVEAGVLVDISFQRRKARGKMAAVEAKLAQLTAKRRITGDKIGIEVQAAYTAMVAAMERVVRARESHVLADELAAIERRKQELGDVDLLSVNIRELQAAEAADVEVDAVYDYFQARADYRAAIALDQIPSPVIAVE